ncbi:MAG: ADP-ribosylglycohydrolase family protein [Bacteroidota bacterium]|nr:ADP-ribosylglycohydrolase family protein [Bacteroidota bacterium]
MTSRSIPEGWGTYDLESGWLIKERDLFKFRAPGSTCLNSLQSGVPGTVEGLLNNSKGCGAVMRMAPVGLMYDDLEQAFRIACDLGALTHGHSSGYLSAGVFAVIIQQIAVGQKLRDAIMVSLEILQEWLGHEEMLQAATQALELYDQTQSSASVSSLALSNLIPQLGQGWVGEEALAISLLCCLSYPYDFRQGVLASVNHSGDSDSTGSITGNILGLINGLDVIPQEWINNLRSADIVRQIGEDLHAGCKSDSFNTNDEWWDRYPGY